MKTFSEVGTGPNIRQLLKESDRQSDRIVGVALSLYFLFGVFLATYYDTFAVAFCIGGLSLLMYFGAKALLPHSTFYQYILSCVLAIFSAQFIYQMHGMFEMHFFVFVGSTLLITYQNWKLQIPLILLVVIHHATFAYLQYAGNKEIYFTQMPYMDLQSFLFHGALAAVIVGICGFWAYDLEKKSISQITQKVALESKLASIKSSIQFAGAISSGNLMVPFELHNQEDDLGKALLKMRDNLIVASEKDRQEKFVSTGLGNISDIISRHGNSLQNLSDEFIRLIVNYTNANQGGLFLVDESEQDTLKLAACYAYDRKKYIDKSIGSGEGLVGQCFIEKDIMFLTEVPKNFTKITSGLGEATPTSILLLPVMTREDIIGVVELASFQKFEKFEIEFLKRACENIASSIVSTRVTEKVKRLLQESQMQAEALRAQEEEMRQNIEELQATQEEMKRREKLNSVKANELTLIGD